MKLKYSLRQEGHRLYFKILEQDVPAGYEFETSSGITIASSDSPELAGGYIFLRGNDKERDNYQDVVVYSDKTEAELWYKMYKTALEEVFGKPSKWSVAFKYGGKSSCK